MSVETIPSIRGKVCVLTGASRGIGEAILRECLERGMRVAACARGASPIEHEDLLYQSVDVADEAALTAFGDAAVHRFGAVDLWINNAGVLEPIQPLRDIDAADFRRLMEVNVMGTFHGSRWFARHVRARSDGGAGVLINISSGAATTGYAGWSAYGASKAAVDRMTESIQLEEADAGLRAHAVAPGIVDTHMQALIRESTVERFPLIEKFRAFKRDDAFNSAEYVARELLALAFDPTRRTQDVVVRLEPEPK